MSAELDVLYADNHLLVVAKPACVPTAPDSSGDASLLELAKAWVKREHAKPGAVYLGLVHRLDRPVSGVVCFARTSKAASRLSESFRARRVQKLYLGVVAGEPSAPRAVLEQWLVKDEATNRVRVAREGAPGAQRAVTRIRLLRSAAGESLVALEPETGRPHQLRLACAALGAPLLGDLKYGAREPLPDQSIALHASALELEHPTRRELERFEAPAPDRPWWNRFA